MLCNVCGRRLGGKYNHGRDTCVVVRDPVGNEKRVHYRCERDADGVRVRTELVTVAKTQKPRNIHQKHHE